VQRLAQQSNEANVRQLARFRAVNLNVRAAKIQNELDARIGSNFLDAILGGVFLFQNPESLHPILEGFVREEFLIFDNGHGYPNIKLRLVTALSIGYWQAGGFS